MTIVLNEHEWVEDMIESHSLGIKPFETLSRVARYYIDKGYSKRDTRKTLDTFLVQCEPSASLPKWDRTLDRAVERATKRPAINIDGIKITKAEMQQIDSLKGKQMRRLAFTLLCLAKYWDAVNHQGSFWVNSKDSDIMRMANIKTSIKRQSEMYFKLKEERMIQFSKKVDNTNVRVCFVAPGNTAMVVTDFRNLGYQYLKYHGEPYFECQNCGITIKMNSNSQKYCAQCYEEEHLRQRVNSIMRRKNRVVDQ